MKKWLKSAGIFVFILALIGFIYHPTAKASQQDFEPVFTYGESLNKDQYNETRKKLGVKRGTQEIEVRTDELNDLLNDNYPYYQVYSSTYITPSRNNGKVNVEIVTPETITTITPLQYENAALTAGATDVDIKVASAVEVDGSGALAGVYKAFADQGYTLDDNAVSTAQDELNTTSQITKGNEGKEGYSDEQLNAAIADMKTQIQQTKDSNNGNITVDDIQVIVNNVVNNYNLTGVLSQEDINSLYNLMEKFGQLNLSDEQKNAISDFGQDLLDQGTQAVDSAKTAWGNMDDEQKSGVVNFFESIGSYLVNIFESFMQMLNNLVNG